MSEQQIPKLSSPPGDFLPKIAFYPFQYIGIPILFLIPLLALFGVFGKWSDGSRKGH
jgi:hypothetical protein